MVIQEKTVVAIIGLFISIIATLPTFALPPAGYNKVAYYTFDATPVDQDYLSLTNFTDNANIVIVFEGTLWELADTVHYDTQWMRNRIYSSKKQILDDIKTLQSRGILVLMNVDDAATWSTTTPFTTWNGKNWITGNSPHSLIPVWMPLDLTVFHLISNTKRWTIHTTGI